MHFQQKPFVWAWVETCTDNDKYDHLFISLLDFLNSLPIFNFTSMTEKAAC